MASIVIPPFQPNGEKFGIAQASAVTETLALTPLQLETRAALPTAEAAAHLNRAQQTLRIWACRENGPLRPIRINRRLAWKTDDIRRLLGVSL